MPHSKRNRGCESLILVFIILGIIFLIVGWVGSTWIMNQTSVKFGAPNPELSFFEKLKYSINLYLSGDKLFIPTNPEIRDEILFTITENEPVFSISDRLQQMELIPNAELFRDLLIYAGLDTKIQEGTFKISHGQNSLEIAVKIQDPSQKMVRFIILAGWRLEEISNTLDASGFIFDGNDINQFSSQSSSSFLGGKIKNLNSLEGFFLPGEYLFERNIQAQDFTDKIISNFIINVDDNMIASFADKGLDLYQAVILASIVEKEAILDGEKPVIASVFLNRLNTGMRLESDPTVQYALGYDSIQKTWWKNPLTFNDLRIDSPYNTYMYPGLPPTPICNPGMESLKAVANPVNTDYLFFRAACDGTGRHAFARTYEEHLNNECP